MPIYTSLKNLGFSVWLDVPQINVGNDITSKIFDGIDKSGLFISIISHNFLKSEWPQKELKTFLEHTEKDGQNSILPIFYKITKAEVWPTLPHLSDIAFESIMDENYEKWHDHVICRIVGKFFENNRINTEWHKLLVNFASKKIDPKFKIIMMLAERFIYNNENFALSIIDSYNIAGISIALHLSEQKEVGKNLYIGFNYLQNVANRIFHNNYSPTFHEMTVADIIAKFSFVDLFQNFSYTANDFSSILAKP